MQVVRKVNVVQNSNEPVSDEAFIRRILRKLGKGKGKMPMEHMISQGLGERISVRRRLPSPTEQERIQYEWNDADHKQLVLFLQEEAARRAGSSLDG